MRILQLIDSLEAGGAERAAVNIANELSKVVTASHLCATRKEGLLKNDINSSVNYLYLNKKKIIDFKAILKLYKYVKKNDIAIIHAHSSSFFLAIIIKILTKNLKVIWHDHYGNSEFLHKRSKTILKICSRGFSHIFSVNLMLEKWANENLKAKSSSYLPNFASQNKNKIEETFLKGVSGKRIIHLANLRPQKDHITLIKAFKNITENHPTWTLHCVGKDFKDAYSENIFKLIEEFNLENNVFIYGSKPDVSFILQQSTIGVLSSISEGLPISLLEYGLHELPVVVTNVGECPKVVDNQNDGFVVEPQNRNELAKALLMLIENPILANQFSKCFKKNISKNYSEQVVIKEIVNRYTTILS